MALHPVGPLPASTYWRRRALVLVAVLAVLLLGRSCLGGDGSTTPRATSTPTSSPTPARTTPTGPPRVCPDTALKLETDTDEATYPVGGKPEITLVVGNTSAVTCTRDLGTKAVELLVYSGEDRVWSSDDCGRGNESSVVTLKPGARSAVKLTWQGKRSKPSCEGSREQAKPGTYRVVARVGTLRAEGAVFRFHA
jgi:hypothetical protein